MPVLPPCPASVAECSLYQRLEAHTSEADDGLVHRLTTFIEAVQPLLDLVIAGPFREYTLHNPGHARKLVHLAEHLIEPETLDRLTALDLTVFIMACHLHDLGMSLTADERARVLSSEEFEGAIRQWPQLWNDIQATRTSLEDVVEEAERLQLEERLFQLHEAALADYLRRRHAYPERYRELIDRLKETTGRADLFSVRGVSFEEELISVCASHGLDVSVLLETTGAYTDRFPRAQAVGALTVNLQFCAGLLRLADILDFDRERTPRVLFESLGIDARDLPGATVTLKERNRHMAVQSISLDDDELVVFADSTHPAIERSILEFCALIEREIRDTAAVLRKNPPAVLEAYRLKVPLTARAQIRSINYVYKDLTFALDETAISNLLMGEGLYPEPAVALRELVQNAIDACRVRALREKPGGYSPTITVSSDTDEHGYVWITTSDNGIGMDEAVLFDYFFRVGRSYYRSSEFDHLKRATGADFAPISRFGIGVLSVFMIADKLEVRTANAYSPRGDTKSRTVRVDSRFGLAFVTEEDDGRQGTEIRIRLSERSETAAAAFLRRAGVYLRGRVRRPPVPVSVRLGHMVFDAVAGRYVSLKPNAHEVLATLGVQPVVVEVERWSDQLAGRAILFFFEGDGGQLLLRPMDGRGRPSDLFGWYLSDYSGNRLTVNGIVMQAKKLGRVLRVEAGQIAGVVDVEVRRDSDIEYDVARQKLTGGSAGVVRSELRRAIASGLRDLGITARLESPYQLQATVTRRGSRGKEPSGEFMNAVLNEVPEGAWPPGLHHVIAERLEVSPNKVYRALSALIDAGRATPTVGEPTSDANGAEGRG